MAVNFCTLRITQPVCAAVLTICICSEFLSFIYTAIRKLLDESTSYTSIEGCVTCCLIVFLCIVI